MTAPSGKKRVTPLTDQENLVMEDVTPAEERGLSLEDAYRHLADMPSAPVAMDEEGAEQ